MNAKPNPGLRGVGGATPKAGAALTNEASANLRCLTRELPALPPAEAMLAALSWHANQAITRQVDVTYSLAELARTHGHAVARTVDASLPAGPLRDAIAASTRTYIDAADRLERAASRFGRHFGHLAFAFSTPG